MLRTIIIDDEAPARNHIREIINDYFNTIVIVGEADSVETGKAIIQKEKPDLVLLDINLTDGSGFNILEQLSEINFKTIFITACDNYAIKAFQFNALDYILKPIVFEELKNALNKVIAVHDKNYVTKEEVGWIIENYKKQEEDRKIVLNTFNKTFFVDVKNIVYLKGDANYTTFYLNDETNIVTSKTLKTYEEILPSNLFYRVHQSSIVNIDRVREYNKEDGGYIVLEKGIKITIARRRKELFLEMLNQRRN